MSHLVGNPEVRFSREMAHFKDPSRTVKEHLSRVVRKPAFCICENKDTDQLHCSREAEQRLCFHYIDSTIPLVPKYEISSLQPSSVAVQPSLCRTRSKTKTLVSS